MTHIVAHLSNNERLVTALFQELRYSLGVYAKKWIRRQTFAFVCAQLIASNAISGDRFSQEMLPNLLKLSTDKVPNVRLAVARTLSRNVVPMGRKYLLMILLNLSSSKSWPGLCRDERESSNTLASYTF